MINEAEFRAECEAQLGKPYIWGADGPDAFDCSGLVQWALSLVNLDPPGDQTAEGLYRFFEGGRSSPMTLEQSALGDLVFFGSAEAVTHVAIAWADGEMFEAGGGGHTVRTVAEAERKDAKVRVAKIARRTDLVAILRPALLRWDVGAKAAPGGFGQFENAPPEVEWLDDGRNMRLVRPFGYVDNAALDWPVPERTVVDGASIPQIFWGLIGGPFEGPYRNASIVHDHYCVTQTRGWRETHRMFYAAMRCGGVEATKAKLMYYAVYGFGPRWTMTALSPGLLAQVGAPEAKALPHPAPVAAHSFDPERFEAIANRILTEDPDLNTIDAMADAAPGAAG